MAFFDKLVLAIYIYLTFLNCPFEPVSVIYRTRKNHSKLCNERLNDHELGGFETFYSFNEIERYASHKKL